MATKRLVTLLEPVMIVIMGIVVGGVVAADVLAVYRLLAAVQRQPVRAEIVFLAQQPTAHRLNLHKRHLKVAFAGRAGLQPLQNISALRR